MRKVIAPAAAGGSHGPRLVILLALLAWPLFSATAQDGDQMGFTTYYFTDSGDNNVMTTSFRLAKKLLQATVFMIDIELDNVTVPAVTAVTGATRPQRRKSEPFEKSRGQVILGVEQGLGASTAVAANVYRSQEVDYVSTAAIGTLRQELNDQNTTIVLRGQYNADVVGKILENGDLTHQKKKTITGALNLAQILSPTTVLDVSYDMVYTWGFQSDPYRQVRVYDMDGTSQLTDELHPGARTRHAGTVRCSQMVPGIRAALIGSYRYYMDTWKVRSHTAELKLNKYIVNDVVLGLDYRYYTQSDAWFTRDRYTGPEFRLDAFRTADYKLKRFASNNVGISLTYLLRGLVKSNPDLDFLEDSSIEVMYFRYFNDLDFSADIIQASIRFSI
jgi:hypothetical protein